MKIKDAKHYIIKAEKNEKGYFSIPSSCRDLKILDGGSLDNPVVGAIINAFDEQYSDKSPFSVNGYFVSVRKECLLIGNFGFNANKNEIHSYRYDHHILDGNKLYELSKKGDRRLYKIKKVLEDEN